MQRALQAGAAAKLLFEGGTADYFCIGMVQSCLDVESQDADVLELADALARAGVGMGWRAGQPNKPLQLTADGSYAAAGRT